MKKTALLLAFLFGSGLAHSQSIVAAASQSLKLPPEISSIAIWPVELKSGSLDEGLLNAASDEIEQAFSRKARENKIKIVTRRQLGNLLSEMKLTNADKTSFDQLAKSTGVDAVVLPSGSLSQSGCLSIVINVIGTSAGNKGEIISSAKTLKINTGSGDLDFSGCK
jgi:hypothetical protein